MKYELRYMLLRRDIQKNVIFVILAVSRFGHF